MNALLPGNSAIFLILLFTANEQACDLRLKRVLIDQILIIGHGVFERTGYFCSHIEITILNRSYFAKDNGRGTPGHTNNPVKP